MSNNNGYNALFLLRLARTNDHQHNIENIPAFSLRQTYLNSRECPHCGSHHVHSNGNYKGRKRYLCKKCGKTYNDLTNTPFSGIHDFNKIKKYLNCMINGDSIRKAAFKVNISITTSFNWRHKLLKGLNKIPSPKMKNVKEIMELELPYSHKGQKSKIPENLKKTKISAVFVCDRTGKLDSDSIPLPQRSQNPIFTRIKETSNRHTEVISPTKFENNIFPFIRNMNSSTYSQPKVVSQLISLWQIWMKRFRGVASKYLSNYLHWFDYLDNSLYNHDKVPDLLQLLLKH